MTTEDYMNEEKALKQDLKFTAIGMFFAFVGLGVILLSMYMNG